MVEQLADLPPQGRHPVRVLRIDALGQVEEMPDVAPGTDRQAFALTEPQPSGFS